MKSRLLLPIIAITALSVVACSDANDSDTNQSAATSSQEPTILRFSHFWPATSSINQEVFEPWVKKIEADSNGLLKVDFCHPK